MAKERSKRIIMSGNPNPHNVKMWEMYKRAKLIAGRSEKTLYGYESDIMQFLRFLNAECMDALLTDIDETEIESYIGYCMEQGNNEKRIRRRISSVSSLLAYLKKKKKVKDNWCELIERPGCGEEVHKRTFLTEDQLAELKKKLSEQDNLQLETYINFGLSTMARSNAIAQITWDMVDLENRWIIGVTEKGGKVRNLRFDENVKSLLVRLKEERKAKEINFPYVFCTYHHGQYGQVSSGSLCAWVKKAFALVGVGGGFNHDLRHSMSNILKDRGMPITTISKLLGHQGVDVTINHYTIENLDRLAEEFDSFM